MTISSGAGGGGGGGDREEKINDVNLTRVSRLCVQR